MAIRTNCIEYGWETDQTIIRSGSLFTSATKQIFIPETTNRTFTDVIVQFHGRNTGIQAASNIGAYSVSIQIDNNPTESFTTPFIANTTAEQLSYTLHFTSSDYFNTYFTASNHAVKLYTKPDAVIGNNTIGQSYKLICTYAFEDANTNTSIKTVRLPINSITASALTTTEVYLGNYTASIPALDTYLPENSKSFKDIFIEYHANDASGATTNFKLTTRIDTNAAESRFTVSQSLQSSANYYDIQILSGSIDTATTHSIRVASTLASRLTRLCGIIYATYEYDYTGSTTIMNSNILSLGEPMIMYQRNVETAYKKTIYIPEESPIVLKRSAAMLFPMGNVVRDIAISTNTSSFTQYPQVTGTSITGHFPVMHQIDGTGSSDPTPFPLTTGSNDIVIYHNNVGSLSAGGHIINGGLLYLNYYSGIAANTKPLEYTHTITNTLRTNVSFGSGASSFFYNGYSGSLQISESRYFISDLTNQFYYISGKISNLPIYSIFQGVCFYTGSDLYLPNINPISIGTTAWANSARTEFFIYTHDMTDDIVRYREFIPTQNKPRINLRNFHSYQHRQINVSSNSIPNLTHIQLASYYTKTFPVTGSIVNYSGSGADIPISAYDYSTGQKLFATQSLSGGIIDAYWYDRHTNLLLIAETGSRYVSNVLPAGDSGSFLIAIPTSSAAPGSSGEKSFTFVS